MATQPGGNLGFNPYASPAINRLEQSNVSAVNNVAATGSRTADLNPKQSSWEDNSKIPTSAPAKAPAAPSGTTTTVFTGLCDAINEFQKTLVKPGGYTIADVYEIQFAPNTIASSTVAIQGVEYKATPTVQQKTANAQLNPETQKMDTTGRIVQVREGTQIIQFIDLVMRSSSYITDQANFIIEESTGKLKPKPNAPANAELKWYKISFQAKSLGWDSGRNDYAYKLIYTVSPYTINRMDSQYFPDSRYHGVHKSYNYWFTGKNNAVLNFEQEYNNMYFTILSQTVGGVGTGPIAGLKNAPLTPGNEPIGKTSSTSSIPKSYAPAASVSNQGAANAANEIGASAADYLYAMSPQGEIKLRIIGDPAWIAQGEITNSINASTINFAPFLPDGTINMDAGEVMFDIYFNRPADYNFDTGVVDVNGKTINPGGTLAALQPQAHLTYTCTSVKSYFNNGKFEQELVGKAFMDGFAEASQNSPEYKAQQAEKQRETEASSSTNTTGTRQATLDSSGNVTKESEIDPNKWDSEPTTTAPAGDITNKAPQPAAPAEAPASNGDIQATEQAGPPINLAGTGAQLLNISSLPAQVVRGIGLDGKPQSTQTMAPKDA